MGDCERGGSEAPFSIISDLASVTIIWPVNELDPILGGCSFSPSKLSDLERVGTAVE